jgi:hypothetical protein
MPRPDKTANDRLFGLIFEFMEKADAVEAGMLEATLRLWLAEYEATAPDSREDVLMFGTAAEVAIREYNEANGIDMAALAASPHEANGDRALTAVA